MQRWRCTRYNEGEVSDRQEARPGGHPPVACAGGASWESAHLASIWENKIWQSCFTQYALLFQRHVMISSADLEAGQY